MGIHAALRGLLMEGKQAMPMAVVFLSLLLQTKPAFAYLDPGTGGMLIQIILGGVAGLAVAGKLFWHQLRSFFGFDKDDNTETESDDT